MSHADFKELCRILEQVDAGLPDGYRTEIIGGKIVVTPWSKASYTLIVEELIQQLRPHTPKGHRAWCRPYLYRFDGQSRAYGPDLHIADTEAVHVDSIFLPGGALSLVGELACALTADVDRGEKTEAYGKAGVPVYVLVDMLKDTVTVHSDPSDHGYRTSTRIEFGGTVHIPAPFDCELDTTGWQA
ncbi:Uma2 family endonuclease [Streptomyces sp. NPDC053079]|uniref:Uma2 family endonuclease n=1 Tax=Streptomyces sp. NPDC053079 TaxID=3365697 RepID=UPI0037D6C110